ncbi:MAG: response regulator, partial [bacterium]|nr:response regulator [bacterium]
MKYSILVADDEINSRQGLGKFLASDTRRVDLAADGREALEKLQKRSYDVLITDIRMPEMDGMTLLQKAKEIDSSLGVIVLTAYGTIEMAV